MGKEKNPAAIRTTGMLMTARFVVHIVLGEHGVENVTDNRKSSNHYQ